MKQPGDVGQGERDQFVDQSIAFRVGEDGAWGRAVEHASLEGRLEFSEFCAKLRRVVKIEGANGEANRRRIGGVCDVGVTLSLTFAIVMIVELTTMNINRIFLVFDFSVSRSLDIHVDWWSVTAVLECS